ncbi:MAG: MoaD/ThiS family protein [Phycisphaerales bacterium]
MRVRVLIFGPYAAAHGAAHIDLDLPDSPAPDASALMRALAASPASAAISPMLEGARLAVNHAFAAHDQPIHPHDEFALIGLVSGG